MVQRRRKYLLAYHPRDYNGASTDYLRSLYVIYCARAASVIDGFGAATILDQVGSTKDVCHYSLDRWIDTDRHKLSLYNGIEHGCEAASTAYESPNRAI